MVLAAIALVGGLARAQDSQPSLVFEEVHASFGEVYQHAVIRHHFVAVNRGPEPVTIEQVLPLSGTGTAVYTPEVVPPEGRLEIDVRERIGPRLGRSSFRIRVQTSDPVQPRYRLTLEGFVQSAYDPEIPRFDFGLIQRADGAQGEQELFCREVDRLEVTGVEGLPEFAELTVAGRAGVAEEGVVLRFRLKPGAPLGLQAGIVSVTTNVPHQDRLLVGYSANAFDDVVPSANPIDLGLVRLGETLDEEIELVSRSGRPFRIEGVADESQRLDIELLDCEEAKGEACQRIRFRHTPEETGLINGTVRVFVSGSDEPLPLMYQGQAATPGAEIKRIDLTGPEDGS